MDYKNIPVIYQPAYTWLWNTTVTKEEIARQIDEMYESGIRAFYALGEPSNFRPTMRRTHLSPEYLTDEYIELVHFAYEYAKKKGMNSWLYNEGGFPSGFAAGIVREKCPETARKTIGCNEFVLEAGKAYAPAENAIAAFIGTERIESGKVFTTDTTLREFRIVEGDAPRCTRTDNAQMKNVEIFLEVTHEALKKRFGDAMGTDVTLMFDDESYMTNWTPGMEEMFKARYGYDMLDYLPFITRKMQPETDDQYRAVSDHLMLCGDLVRDNYFIPMKKWLNEHNMLSTGHLDNDNKTDGTIRNYYGNLMQTLRAFDVPGIDVIWSQIGYPDEKGRCCSDTPRDSDHRNFEFFPLIASSAARQQGHTKAVSETFAVYGSHVNGEEMRYNVTYQAVRGISLFNFMVISFDRKTPMCLQYRPNFNGENPGMDMLSQIDNYTARISAILQNSKADVRTALYYPLRSICAAGVKGRAAEDAFAAIGNILEANCVSFDIIDEELVESGRTEDGRLICEHVEYDNVFVPFGDFERPEIISKLSTCNKKLVPTIGRTASKLMARKMAFENSDDGYFVANCDGVTLNDTVAIKTSKTPYAIDLDTGDICEIEYTRDGDNVLVPVTLMRGEAIMLLLTDKKRTFRPIIREVEGSRTVLEDVKGYINRRYSLDKFNAPANEYFTEETGEKVGLCGWDITYSGEATYTAVIPKLSESEGTVMLDLGEVHHFARVMLNGEKIGEVTMPPYILPLGCACHKVKEGDVLTVTVANTISNVCARAEYFGKQDPADVGGYHKNMRNFEERLSVQGGLIGPVSVYIAK